MNNATDRNLVASACGDSCPFDRADARTQDQYRRSQSVASLDRVEGKCARGTVVQRLWFVQALQGRPISENDGKLDTPKSPLPEVHRLYFKPEYHEFSPRTMWSLSNAFTSAFKRLDPVPQFKATAKLGEFLSQLPA